MDESDLEFVIPDDAETYLDLHIHLSVRGKLVAPDGYALGPAASTSMDYNLLHSLQKEQRHPERGVCLAFEGSLQL